MEERRHHIGDGPERSPDLFADDLTEIVALKAGFQSPFSLFAGASAGGQRSSRKAPMKTVSGPKLYG